LTSPLFEQTCSHFVQTAKGNVSIRIGTRSARTIRRSQKDSSQGAPGDLDGIARFDDEVRRLDLFVLISTATESSQQTILDACLNAALPRPPRA
jgi:hypothetical protein